MPPVGIDATPEPASIARTPAEPAPPTGVEAFAGTDPAVPAPPSAATRGAPMPPLPLAGMATLPPLTGDSDCTGDEPLEQAPTSEHASDKRA